MKSALVVGAGMAGATAARELAEAGYLVTIIDKRDHVAGNAYDYVNEHEIRVHKYGPHLWHTSNEAVQAWASHFTAWNRYDHRVKAAVFLNNVHQHVPLPINNETIEIIFLNEFISWCRLNGYMGLNGPKGEAYQAFLESLVEHHEEVTNSRQHVENSVGKKLCDILFAPYTKKMWGLNLEELPAGVAARIPTSVGTWDSRYFPKDKYQCLPVHGYTQMVSNILEHENINIKLSTARQDIPTEKFDVIFTSEPIDTYFGCDYGALPWRSIKMHVENVPLPLALVSPVMNFTHDGKYTRVTEWKQLPCHGESLTHTTLTFEEPCDYKDNNNERYYPVRSSDPADPARALYNRYRERALQDPRVIFIGRMGRYVYTDMAPCIASTLAQVKRYLNDEPQVE